MGVKHGVTLRKIKWKVLEKRVLRNVFETEREEEAGGWRELHSGRLYDLHCTVGGDRKSTRQNAGIN
jgi:hypothetical protein